MSDTRCEHLWASNTGADFGGYRPSEVYGLRYHCVKCGMAWEDAEYAALCSAEDEHESPHH